ncbi:MAG: acetate/propionate family kinase [Deltaproteobacteria bacterium]|nr:acetate/propionate family kinase [Deltaproteobacteria bacterium]
MNILTVNVGSGSVRLCAHGGESERFRLRAATHLGIDAPQEPSAALAQFLSWHGLPPPDAVVHRVVHGGAEIRGPCLLDGRAEQALEALAPLAPLYVPRALAWLRATRALPGSPPCYAVPDTGFFADLPLEASTYPLPRELTERLGLRRYGFHGLAHRSMLRSFQTLRPELPRGGKLVTLQLGAGSSAAAIQDGKPVDTSMGFSPLEGLVMATRAGDLDPGVVLHLIRRGGMDAEAVERMLSNESGLLGLSGLSGDVRTLRATQTAAAQLALDVYTRRARKYLGGYLALLGGADGIVLGGGVAEHDPDTRSAILGGLEPLGIAFDAEANRDGRGRPLRLSTPDSRTQVWLVAVDEAMEMLLEAAPLLSD